MMINSGQSASSDQSTNSDQSANSDQSTSQSAIKRALRAIADLQAKLDAVTYAQREPIAIVGMGCRLPGGVDTPEAFWQVLHQGIDTITEVPRDRWDLQTFYDSHPDTPGKMTTRYGGFLSQIDQFDPHFFGIPVREAMSLDPQQRLLLEVSWEALERAGAAPETLQNSLTGVFVAISTDDYTRRITEGDSTQVDAYYGTGNAHSVAAGRLSYTLGLKGPSFAIDAACSSALVAVHLACQSLRQRECDQALAGGVNVMLAPHNSIALSKARMLAPDGRCKTFDASADGYVRGEGCGVVVLKRLSDAIANRDTILAVIQGSALNHNGRSSSLVAHSGPAQQAVMQQALQASGVQPADLDYVEVNGTGSALIEPIEVGALGAVFGQDPQRQSPLIIGSVKTNIGHLEGAAGIASLLKVVLALQHEEIPPHLHLQQPNPHIPWETLPLQVPTTPVPWPRSNRKRLAGINTFGFSGANAHLIVAEAPAIAPPQTGCDRPYHLLTLSAKTEAALMQLAARLQTYLIDHPNSDLADVCYSANTGRNQFSHRLAVVGACRDEMTQALRQQTIGKTESYRGKANVAPSVTFAFPDQGEDLRHLSCSLYATQSVFRAAIQQCEAALLPDLKIPLSSMFSPASDVISGLNTGDSALAAAVSLFAVEYALAEVWLAWGVLPDRVVGKGLGDWVAACIAGVLTLEDALKLLVARHHWQIALQANATAVMPPFTAALLETITCHSPRIPFTPSLAVSTGADVGTLAYWRQACQRPWSETGLLVPCDRQETNLAEQQTGTTICLIMGSAVPQQADGNDPAAPSTATVYIHSLSAAADPWKMLLSGLARLYVQGVNVNWVAFEQDDQRCKLPLPTYPWQRQRYWMEPTSQSASRSNDTSSAASTLRHPLDWQDTHSVEQFLAAIAPLPHDAEAIAARIEQAVETYRQKLTAAWISEGYPTPATPAITLMPVSPPQTVAEIQQWMTMQISQELGIPAHEVDPTLPFDHYGLDSVLAISIASRGKKLLGVDIAPIVMMQYPTIAQLSQHLAQTLEASESEIFEI